MTRGFGESLRSGCGAPAAIEKPLKTSPHLMRSRCPATGALPRKLGKKSAALMKRRWRWQTERNRLNARRSRFLKDSEQARHLKSCGKPCAQLGCAAFRAAQDPAPRGI